MPFQVVVEAQPEQLITNQVTSKTKPAEHLTDLTRDQIIDAVAYVLDSYIQDKGKDYKESEEIAVKTCFHAKKLPPISIKNYLSRFATHSNCHEDTFIYALIYLDRIEENIEEFSLDSFNALRLILLSAVSAIKLYDDFYYTNKYYAKIGGVPLEEFNQLEKEYLCNYLNFGLYVDVDTYKSYYHDLIKITEQKLNEKGSL